MTKRKRLEELDLPGKIETIGPSPAGMSVKVNREKLLQQGWEEVRHKGKIIGYLNPNVMMSHPAYNLEQAMEIYGRMNEERYGQVKLPWET